MVSNNLSLLNELLRQIYAKPIKSSHVNASRARPTSRARSNCRCSISSNESNVSNSNECNFSLPHYGLCDCNKCHLAHLDIRRLQNLIDQLTKSIHAISNDLVTSLRHRDFLLTEQNQLCDLITATLQAISCKRVSDAKLRFTIEARTATDSSYKQWVDAMRMVVRLPGGIPPEFRRKLWITLSEKYIQSKQINWQGKIESCFSDRANPDDETLGEQIIKDLHRTGCDLFSGADASVNQALLKQVLLAFARWNKSVGYCQGFNILAAVILEVVEWKVEQALMVMIFLIEGLLPESYFANNLRGLSVDMAVFRDLMKIHANDLSNHLDHLQYSSLEGVACYEPPLVNVFTLQWFLTLFSNCLPKSLVLRIWDLIFLEGSEILLRTALVIWNNLSNQIHSVKSADEFYSIMGLLTMQLMEYTTTDGNQLITDIINLADFPYAKVSELREKYTYHIRPLSSSAGSSPSTASSLSGSSSPFSFVKKGLHLLPFASSSDEDDSGDHFDFFFHQEQLVSSLARPASPCVSTGGDAAGRHRSTNSSSSAGTSSPDRVSLDVSLLRKQYVKLCQRQKQAHLILTEGLRYGYSSTFNRSSSSNTAGDSGKTSGKSGTSKNCKDQSTINSLLSGKPALTVKSSSKQPLVAVPSASLDKVNLPENSKLAAKERGSESNGKKPLHPQRRGSKEKDDCYRLSSAASSDSGRKGDGPPCKERVHANHCSDKNRSSASQSGNETSERKRSTGGRGDVSSSSGNVKSGAKKRSKLKGDARANHCRSNDEPSESTQSDSSVASYDHSSEGAPLATTEHSHSSSTSVNNSSSSSSSIASHASSVSTVSTVVMKKRKKSDEASSNSLENKRAPEEADVDSSSCKSSSKPSTVVVRRRFGPNVRRASSILEQSSFSMDEPGDDETTSSSDDERRTSGNKEASSTSATSKGLSNRRKEFQRRHQNTVTLTWSEIRKIRKASAPASVIRSSLSSPPSDLSPCHDDAATSPTENVAFEKTSSEARKDEQAIESSGTNEPARVDVHVSPLGNGHSSVPTMADSPVALATSCSPIKVKSVVDEPTSSAMMSSIQSRETRTKQENQVHESFARDKSTSSRSTEQSGPTMGPDDEETECDNGSDLELDSPSAASHAKLCPEPLSVVDGGEDAGNGKADHVASKEEADGEERIIKSVQSEISNLTIEECLARLSARISTLNSELQ